jgi:hypothetical protein
MSARRSFPAPHALADRLINHMGFEALDVASMIAPAINLPLFEQNQPLPSVEWSEIATTFIAITPTPELQAATGVSVVEMGGAAQVVVTGHISAELEGLMLVQVRGAKKLEQVREKVAEHNALVAAQQAPASRGEPFAPVPTLGYRTQAQAPLWPLEREAVLETVELDLMTPQAIQLPGFQVVAQSNTFEIYLKDAHVRLRPADASQIAMDYGASTITPDDLVRWLDQSLFQKLPDLTQTERRAYLTAVVNYLLHERGVPLVVLAQARFKLAQDIENRVAELRDQAARQSFHQLVLQADNAQGWLVEPDWQHPHLFEAGRYPAPVASRYSGRYQFPKHYFPVLADLKEDGQEFACAQLIDRRARSKMALLASVFVIAACGCCTSWRPPRWPATCWATRCCSSPPSSGPTCLPWAWAPTCRVFRAATARAFFAHRVAGGAGRGALPALLFLANAYVPGRSASVLYALVLLVGMLVGLEIPLVMRILKRNVALKDLVSQVLTFDYLGALAVSVAFPLVLVPQARADPHRLAVRADERAVAVWALWLFRFELRHFAAHAVACGLYAGRAAGGLWVPMHHHPWPKTGFMPTQVVYAASLTLSAHCGHNNPASGPRRDTGCSSTATCSLPSATNTATTRRWCTPPWPRTVHRARWRCWAAATAWRCAKSSSTPASSRSPWLSWTRP